VASDPLNCGVCGHNCQGGACGPNPSGATACQPLLLTPSNFTGGQLAINGDSVYVLDYGSAGVNERVLRFSKATGQGVVLTSVTGNIFNIAADNNFFYWTTQPGTDIGVINRSMPDGSVVHQFGTSPGASAIAVDSSGVAFFLTGTAAGGAADSAIMRLAPADAGPSMVLGTQLRIGALAVDANNLYWFTTSVQPDGSDSFVRAMPKNGGTITTIANPQPNATGTGMAIAAFNGNVYWVPRGLGNTDGQANGARPFNSGTIIPYATALERPIAVVADASFVYWTVLGNSADGLVERSPVPSGTPVALVNNLHSPLSIGLDGNVLYFTTLGDATTGGGLYRLVLP